MEDKGEFILRGIPHVMIEKVWPLAEPYVKRGLEHSYGEVSHLDLKRQCLERDGQLWVAYKKSGRIVGAGTTEIVQYPQMKVCRIITLAGSEFDEWMEMSHQIIEAWALEQGCDGIEAFVRRGFVPKLKDIGYQFRYAWLHKRIRE
jgi:hypothetical protein